MPESSSRVPRRTLTKAAAWSVPAVGVITAAPAFATSPSLPPYVGDRLLTYRVWAKPNGVAPLPPETVPPYTTPWGTVDLGIWTVRIGAGGRTFPPDDLSPDRWGADMTMSQDGAALLRDFSVVAVSGSMTQHYTVAGDVVAPGSRTAELTVWRLPVPEEGDITLGAYGETAWETPTADYGSFMRFLGSWTATITAEGSQFIDSIGLAGALDPADQEVYLGPTLIYPYPVD